MSRQSPPAGAEPRCLRLALLLRRVLAPLLYPRCAGPWFCRPHTLHSDYSIRDVCLLCGKKGPRIRVVGPF